MKVFVLGGTGALGGYAIPELVAAGHEVTAAARSPEKAQRLTAQGATPATVSLFDAEALRAAFGGQDAVVNIATAIPPPSKFFLRSAWSENDRIRTEGSAAVASAATEAGVPKLLQESIVFTYVDSGEMVDERTPVDGKGLLASALVAEGNALAHSGGVVLRFGLFYGRGSDQTEQFLSMARKRIAGMPAPGGTHLSSVHLADAATAVVAALDVPPGIYNVVDDEPVTGREYADAIAAAVGRPAWVRGPGSLMKASPTASAAVSRSHRVSNAKFRATAGWAPQYPSVREGYAAEAAQQDR